MITTHFTNPIFLLQHLHRVARLSKVVRNAESRKTCSDDDEAQAKFGASVEQCLR